MKTVEAYFCSWCFPPLDSEEKDHATVEIKYADGTWEEIFRMPLGKNESISEESQRMCARAVLRHFLGYEPSMRQVTELVNMPGSSLCRLEPEQLMKFKQLSLFR